MNHKKNLVPEQQSLNFSIVQTTSLIAKAERLFYKLGLILSPLHFDPLFITTPLVIVPLLVITTPSFILTTLDVTSSFVIHPPPPMGHLHLCKFWAKPKTYRFNTIISNCLVQVHPHEAPTCLSPLPTVHHNWPKIPPCCNGQVKCEILTHDYVINFNAIQSEKVCYEEHNIELSIRCLSSSIKKYELKKQDENTDQVVVSETIKKHFLPGEMNKMINTSLCTENNIIIRERNPSCCIKEWVSTEWLMTLTAIGTAMKIYVVLSKKFVRRTTKM